MNNSQITLAGQSWPVSFFVLGEQKTLVPNIYAAQEELRTNGISQKYMDAIIGILAFVIARADPTFDRGKIEALPTSLPEIQAAFLVICHQAGMGLTPVGETKAS